MRPLPLPVPTNPPIITPKTSNPTSAKTSPTATAQSESSNLSPKHQQTEPLDVSQLSAYQDPNWGETEENESGGRVSEGEKDEAEEIMATEAKIDEAEREEIDLNKMARKQGLMTDDEFQAVLGKGDRIVVNPEGVAEILDLASQAVGKGETTTEAKEWKA